MVGAAVPVFTGKLPFTVVSRIVTAEEVCAADAVALQQVARDVSPDVGLENAASHHLVALPASLLIVGSKLHILLRLATAVAALHPVAFTAYPRCYGVAHILQRTHQHASHVAHHDAGRTVDHRCQFALKISQPVQGVLLTSHRHIGIGGGDVAWYVFHHDFSTPVPHLLQLASHSGKYSHILAHTVGRESGRSCNE